MKQLNHPNVMRLFEVIDDPTQDKMYLIMPLSDYGDSMIFNSHTSTFAPNNKFQTTSSIQKHDFGKEGTNFYDESTVQKLAF